MNFKGKSKIELFENGLLVKEHIDHNLVTNFLNEMINIFFMKITRGSSTACYTFPTTTYDVGFLSFVDGVVLFEDPLILNAAKYRLPTNNSMVAYAAGIAPNTDPRGGLLNLTESIFDGPGKTQKLVFDFATDKGNGTFESLGILPGRGARSFDHEVSGKDNGCGAHTMDFDAATYYDPLADLGMDIPLGLINGIIYGTVYDSALTGAVPIYRRNSYFAEFTPFNPFDYKRYVEANEALSDLEYVIPAGRIGDLKILNNKFYILEHNQSSPYDIDIKELNPANMAVISTVNVSVSDNMYYNWLYSFAQIAGDILYISKGVDRTVLYKYNIITGNFIESLTPPAPFTAFDRMFHINEDGSLLMIGTNLGSSFMMLDANGLSSPFRNVTAFYSSRNTAIPKGPTISYMYNGAPRIALMTMGLITLNNLALPITKTSAQTMKITYTLSW